VAQTDSQSTSPSRATAQPPLALVIVMAALMAVAPFTIDAYLPSMPSLAVHFDAPMALVQLSLSLYMLGFAGGQLFIGPWSDRVGRRVPIFIALSLYIAGSLLCSFAPSMELLNAARFLQGLGAGVGPVVVRAMVRDRFEREESARLMSLLGMIFMIAPMVAPFVGGWILTLIGWQAIFLFLACYGAVALVSTLFIVKETLPRERRSTAPLLSILNDYRSLLRDRRFLGFSLASSAAFAGMFAFFSGSPFVYIDHYGVSPQNYGWLFGVNVVLMMGLNFVNRRLVPRFGSERLMRWALNVNLFGGLSLILLAFFPFGGLPVLVTCVAFLISPLSMIGANSMAGALDKFPHIAGTASALSGAISYSIGIMAGLLVGQLHGMGDGAMSLGAMNIVMGGMAICATLASRYLIGSPKT
jgi:DHA1 family bicyclomycin/chloramphenicol resistance-like MFS transporter